MIASPTEVVRGHETFRALLLALSYPGRTFVLPAAGDAQEAAAAIVAALFEPGTPAWTCGDWHAPSALAPAACDEADVLLVAGASSGGALLRARRGSEQRPQDGATAIYAVGDGPAIDVRVSGPGVDGRLACTLPLSAEELADREQACAQWPLGVDLVVVGPDLAVRALPRTTRVEVLR